MRQGLIRALSAGIPDSLKTLRRAALIEETLREQGIPRTSKHAEKPGDSLRVHRNPLADLGDRRGGPWRITGIPCLGPIGEPPKPPERFRSYQFWWTITGFSRAARQRPATAPARRDGRKRPSAPWAGSRRRFRERRALPYAPRSRQWLGEVIESWPKPPDASAARTGPKTGERPARPCAESVEAWKKIAAAKVPGIPARELQESAAELAEATASLRVLAATPGR